MTSGRDEKTLALSIPAAAKSIADSNSGSGRRNPLRALFRCLIAIVIVVQFFGFIRVSERYPFYFLWDMDQFAVAETIGINSGLIPTMLLHPGFGMHLLTHLISLPAHHFGLIAAYDVRDLDSSINPFFPVAELTDFFRRLSPVLVLGIVVALWSSVTLHFNLSAGWSLLTLTALSTQQSLLYQAAMIRFELYAAFYWSLAVLLVVFAARSRGPAAFWGWLVGAGLLLGLSYSSKVQAIFYVLSFPFIALFLLNTGRVRLDNFPTVTKTSAALFTWTTAVGFVAFTSLLISAMATELPSDVAQVVSNIVRLIRSQNSQNVDSSTAQFIGDDASANAAIGYPIIGIGVVVAGGILVALHMNSRKHLDNKSAPYQTAALASCLFTGFVSSLFLHFLMYQAPSTSLHYLLYDMKFMFALPLGSGTESLSSLLRLAGEQLAFNRVFFIVAGFAVLSIVAATALRWVVVPPGAVRYLLVAYVFVAATLIFCARLVLRDLLWVELLPAFLSVLALVILAQATRHRPFLQGLSASGLIVLSLSNWQSARLIPDRLDANYNVYGWSAAQWFGELLWDNAAYAGAVRDQETTLKEANFAVATRHQSVKGIARFVFKNLDVDLHGAGVISEGSRVWRDDKIQRIVKFPAALRGALVFDVSGFAPENSFFFTKADRAEDSLDKVIPPPSGRPDPNAHRDTWLSILGRLDLAIYIFLSEEDRAVLASSDPKVVPVDFSITVGEGQQSRVLWGAEIVNYTEVPVSRFSSRYFFVVAPRASARSAWLALWP